MNDVQVAVADGGVLVSVSVDVVVVVVVAVSVDVVMMVDVQAVETMIGFVTREYW
jgi:hypothetical protein